MAYITEKTCNFCHRTERTDGHTWRGMCSACKSRKVKLDRAQHLAGLTGLTFEERIDRIEKMLYDLHIEERLKALEAKTQTYA